MKQETIRLLIDFVVVPLIGFGVYVLQDLSKSVANLNVQVGVLISNNNSLEKRIDRLEAKVFNSK
jgi:prefoldin subunit 5